MTNENFTNSVRRGIRFRELAIQLLYVVVVGGCCRETSSARASFSIEKPEKTERRDFQSYIKPALAYTKTTTLLKYLTLLFILLLLLLVMK